MRTSGAAVAGLQRLAALTDLLREAGRDPVVLEGGRGRQRTAALDRLRPDNGSLLVVATGPYVGEGFDCPALDTLFLAAPIAFKGRLVQYVGRVLRPASGKTVVEVHDYHDVETGVLASSLAERAAGYISLGFPDPRRLRHLSWILTHLAADAETSPAATVDRIARDVERLRRQLVSIPPQAGQLAHHGSAVGRRSRRQAD